MADKIFTANPQNCPITAAQTFSSGMNNACRGQNGVFADMKNPYNANERMCRQVCAQCIAPLMEETDGCRHRRRGDAGDRLPPNLHLHRRPPVGRQAGRPGRRRGTACSPSA